MKIYGLLLLLLFVVVVVVVVVFCVFLLLFLFCFEDGCRALSLEERGGGQHWRREAWKEEALDSLP